MINNVRPKIVLRKRQQPNPKHRKGLVMEAFCLLVDGRLKKNAYLTTSQTDLAVRVLRNTGTPLPIQIATGRAELVEYDVYLDRKHSTVLGGKLTENK